MAKTRISDRYLVAAALLFLLLCGLIGLIGQKDTGPGYALAAPTDPLERETDGLRMAYLGNMGILVAGSGSTLLIDGLHKKYGPAYSFPLESTVDQVIDGEYQDFGKPAIALVTHHHKDHFDPGYHKRFLLGNPGSIVIGPQQVCDQIREEWDSDTLELGSALKQAPYRSKTYEAVHHGLRVRAFKCPHVNPSRHAAVQNLGYLIDIDQYTLLHLGDTNWDVAEPVLREKNISDASLDIAILPYWMLLEERSVEKVRNLIAAKRIVATHVPPDMGMEEYRALKKRHPRMTVFTKLDERLEYR